ncbi:NAC transcription factor 25-like [Camellia sinensis]|uniref:NAC transcription factor 25-like n=1 Tax=Camellia sinensis TaxID=4442 RepID=UPI0010363714|nr:NAC transcription factor 25-like [Camellia sinensis]
MDTTIQGIITQKQVKEKSIVTQLPIGYRFSPTQEELMTHYLINKVLNTPLPSQIMMEIDAIEFYSKPPNNLVSNPTNGRDWCFLIQYDEYFYGERKQIREVGNGIGFWRSIGIEDPIYNSNGDIYAFKINFSYFSGSIPKAKKTHWRMEQFRIHFNCDTKTLKGNEWVLGRLKRGQDYSKPRSKSD